MRTFLQIHAEASALPGFDGEAFAAMVATPSGTSGAERAEVYAALARWNAAAAEELAKLATSPPGNCGRALVAAGLAAATRLRLLAAEPCRTLAGTAVHEAQGARS